MNTIIDKISRRTAIKAGAVAFAAACSGKELFAAPKAPGETRVVLLSGDIHHTGIMHECEWREILGKTGWNVLCTRYTSIVTPEVLADTDLFIVCRHEGTDALGYSPDPLAEKRDKPGYFMTDSMEKAILGNISRGMGFIATHCTVSNPSRPKFLETIGVKKVTMPGLSVPVSIYDINQSHPATKGIDSFETDDQVYVAETLTEKTVPLFRLKQKDSGPDSIGGWCNESGKGRIAVFLPGHKVDVYMNKNYKRMLWNASHWALNREAPSAEHLVDGY